MHLHRPSRTLSASRSVVVAVVAALVAAFAAVLTAAPAEAAVSPVADRQPGGVTADGLPTVQIDGVVWSQAVVGNTVYAGGQFTTARPAGAAPGTNTVARNNLLAYDITTGDLVTSFAPVLNAQVKVVTASPDGSRIYVGGNFTTADGQPRYRLAAYDTATGALISSFQPTLDAAVNALTVTNTTVYAGGVFSVANGVARAQLAAFSASDGSLLGWAPTADNIVDSMVLTPDGTHVVVGGAFANLNGAPALGLGSLDATTGASVPFAANQVVQDSGNATDGSGAAILSLRTDGTAIYGTGYTYDTGTDNYGNFEGVFSADPTTGAINWLADCHGDSYDVYPAATQVYAVSHHHYCANIGGFPDTNPRSVWYRADAFTKKATGTVLTNGESGAGYGNFAGQPSPSLTTWFPTLEAGTYTQQYQAAWSLGGNANYVVAGGEFPTVNGVAQQGLVRFAVPALAPNKVGPQDTSSATTPTLTAPFNSVVNVSFLANDDLDNQTLTYNLYRGGSSTPVWSTTAPSEPWSRPTLTFRDSGLTAGTSYTYYVTASDPDGNTVRSASASITTPTTQPTGTPPADAYGRAVYADGPTAYWRLDDTSGTTAADASDYRHTGTYFGKYTRGVTSPVSGATGTAVTFNGSNGAVGSAATFANPTSYTEEVWFKTTTTRGGKLMGFGTSRSGSSASYDRHVYMTNSGQLVFGAYAGSAVTVMSPKKYNDGGWHFVSATQGADGMKLYVDGAQVGSNPATGAQQYTGYWRLAGDNLTGWPSKPSSNYFAGTLDEAALFLTNLSAAQIQAHYHASPAAQNIPPTASATVSCTNLSCTADGSGSSDPDGTVAAYSWNFGDGTSATGVSATHSYAAAGTYTVTLTVTDNSGATASTTRTVTVAGPTNQPPKAVLAASCTGLACTFDGTGSSDPDGTVASYAWNFGDGSSSTAAAPSHTYAAVGTYTVTLTVTDNGGATGTATKAITLSQVVASDTFTRTTASGWGSADTGGAWTVSPSSAFATGNGTGSLTLAAPGADATAALAAVRATNPVQTLDVAPQAAPTGNGVFVTTRSRVNSNSFYEITLRLLPGGVVHLADGKVVNGVETVIHEINVATLTYNAGDTLRLRTEVSGNGTTSTLKATVWKVGSAQPSTPQLADTDAEASLQGSGAVGLEGYLSGSSTAAMTLLVDNFSTLDQ